MFLSRYLTSAALIVYLYSFGFLFRKNRIYIYQIYQVLYFILNPKVVGELVVKPIQEIFPNAGPVEIIEPATRQGNTTHFESIVLNTFAKQLKPSKIFEIGTFDGRTTLNLTLNSPEKVTTYTLDLPKETQNSAAFDVSHSDQRLINTNVTGTRFTKEKNREYLKNKEVIQLLGDSANFDFSPYYNSIDLIFVDGAHTYNYVKSDSEHALKMLGDRKGIILWHDYDYKHPGSIKAVDEIQENNPDWKMFHVENTNIACLIR